MAQARRSLAPLTGVGFVVLLVAATAVGGEPPTADAPAQEIVSFYADDQGRLMTGAILFSLGAILFLFFVGSLRSILRLAEGSTGWLSTVAFGGGVIATAGLLISSGISFTLTNSADQIEPTAFQAINALSTYLFMPIAGGLVAFLFATGLVVVRTKVLPVWLAWAALVLAVVGLSPISFFALLLTLLWILVVSILLTRGGSATSASSL